MTTKRILSYLAVLPTISVVFNIILLLSCTIGQTVNQSIWFDSVNLPIKSSKQNLEEVQEEEEEEYEEQESTGRAEKRKKQEKKNRKKEKRWG